MLDALEKQKRLTGNQRRLLFVAILCDLLEFYDFYIVGFVLAFVGASWKLTYGRSAIILLSSGVGAILGAVFWGWLADRIGRRRVVIATVFNFSLATGAMALTPEGGWIFLSTLRFFVGIGVGGLYCVILPLVTYLAACYAVAGIVYAGFGMETRSRSLDEIEERLALSADL